MHIRVYKLFGTDRYNLFSSVLVHCGPRAIAYLLQCQRGNHCMWLKITITKHNKRQSVCIIIGIYPNPWWSHQMETFYALLGLCAGNLPVIGEFPSQRPLTRSFDVFFDIRLNKRLSEQSWGWWFETPSRSFWRNCNVVLNEDTRCSRSRLMRPVCQHIYCCKKVDTTLQINIRRRHFYYDNDYNENDHIENDNNKTRTWYLNLTL